MKTLCNHCYFNTQNSFFDPTVSSNGKITEECVFNVQTYPKAQDCLKYEPAHKDVEAEE